MRKDFWFDSQGVGRLHGICWMPEGKPRAIIQIIHGIAEYTKRYDAFASYLCSQGILVVGEDHMGHGDSVGESGIRGYFHGGWFTAVDDSYRLLQATQKEYPDVPYILFGHSMGSFMARTILCKYPESGIKAAIICGTGWQPTAAMPLLIRVVESICNKNGETKPNEPLQKLVFGSYNNKVEHPQTDYDWLTRDKAIVQAYIEDPMCGFTASAGLLREMMKGIYYIQQRKNLQNMCKETPVLLIAGGDDPVGSYGKGVQTCAAEFRKVGMSWVDTKIYPLCRHEILNEINKAEIFQDIMEWVEDKIK